MTGTQPPSRLQPPAGLQPPVAAPVAPEPSAEAAAATRVRLFGILFALGAAMAYAVSQVLTRYGVEGSTPPLVGTLIALFWGTLGFAVLSFRALLTQRSEHLLRGVLYFSSGGIFSAMGVILLFEALLQGQVVIVAPVAATNPLFTLLFVVLLLRGIERITWRVVLGALLVMCGVIVLSVF